MGGGVVACRDSRDGGCALVEPTLLGLEFLVCDVCRMRFRRLPGFHARCSYPAAVASDRGKGQHRTVLFQFDTDVSPRNRKLNGNPI